MTFMPSQQPDVSALLAAWQGQRRVRAAAYLTLDRPAWAGSQRVLLVFERRAAAVSTPIHAATSALTLPFEALEEALEALRQGQAALETWLGLSARLGLPPAWLEGLEPLYDPAHALQRLGRVAAPREQWQHYQGQLVEQGRQQLAARRLRGEAAPLQGLLLARRVALEYAYPALAAAQAGWPKAGVRLTHHWRTDFSLGAPRALSLLESLYGFGGEDEARRVLAALRGLGMLPQERLARLAVQRGYFDGATRFVRDEASGHHAADLGRWGQLSPSRRERLGVLLGLERSPLGAAALEVAAKLLDEAAQPNSAGVLTL